VVTGHRLEPSIRQGNVPAIRQENAKVTTNSDHYDPAPGAATAYDTPLGITNPPIDELLDRVSSKYALVIYAAKRARQINDYYNQLGDGILEYVGPLVEPGLQEKPLSIALREIHGDLLEHTEGE
jgi:DNA-directed RNA polymerase subunit omega